MIESPNCKEQDMDHELVLLIGFLEHDHRMLENYQRAGTVNAVLAATG